MKNRVLLWIVAMCVILSLTACGKKCTNGCGSKADPNCMAQMCDDCCDYWMGLNGCYKNH